MYFIVDWNRNSSEVQNCSFIIPLVKRKVNPYTTRPTKIYYLYLLTGKKPANIET